MESVTSCVSSAGKFVFIISFYLCSCVCLLKSHFPYWPRCSFSILGLEGGWRNWQDYDGLIRCRLFYRKAQFWGRRVWVLILSSLTIVNVVQVPVTRQALYKAYLNKHCWKHVLWSSAFPWAIERWHNCNVTPGYYLTSWGSSEAKKIESSRSF